MSTNSVTYASATGITTDRAARAIEKYRALLTRSFRAMLNDDDEAADRYADDARKLAHVESYRGSIDPLIDQLERAYGIE